MRRSEVVEDASSRIFRTVINGDDLQIWVIDFHQCGERGRQFFFFVPRGEENRYARTLCIRRRREILDPRQTHGAICNAESVGQPEECDDSEENESEKMHGNWFQRCPQVMLTRHAK